MPGPLPWGHLHLTAGLQSVCKRQTVPLVLLPRPLSKQLQPLRLSHLLHLGYCPVCPGPHLPMEPPRSLSGALPEGPPVLLLVFQRQREAALTSWLAWPCRALWSWLPASSCLLGVLCDNVAHFRVREFPGLLQGCPESRDWISACSGDLAGGARTELHAPPV